MKKDYLNKKFRHPSWFINSDMTNKDFLDYVIKNEYSFYIKKETIFSSDNLLDESKNICFRLCDEYGYSKKLNDEEIIYLKNHAQENLLKNLNR